MGDEMSRRPPGTITLLFIVALALSPWPSVAQSGPPGPPGGYPPQQAFDDCRGKAAGVVVQHMTPEGSVSATCMDSPDGLVARPDRPSDSHSGQERNRRPGETNADRPSRPASSADLRRPSGGVDQSGKSGPGRYSLDQALSDRAQLSTIAFSGLAFITGSFAASTFIPPGKVSDFFGFQYMRDIDAAGKGHNPMFLDRAAGNVLAVLDAGQLEMFHSEAEVEAAQLKDLALRRLPLIAAFHDQLDGRIPAGSAGLNRDAVIRYAGRLFEADAALAHQRAAVFGRLAASLSDGQKAMLGGMRFGDFNSWPIVDMEHYKLGRGTDHLVNVAYMTLASEFFSWYAGSIEADTYFCPERHGTYFGGFFLKDMPAMAAAASGKRDFDISTALTGDSGDAFLRLLASGQRTIMTEILERQRRPLAEIVGVRRAIANELRRFLAGVTADQGTIVALGRRYGELDGELAWLYATSFARIAGSLTADQRAEMKRLRNGNGQAPAPAYLYSDALGLAPPTDGRTSLFFPPR